MGSGLLTELVGFAFNEVAVSIGWDAVEEVDPVVLPRNPVLGPFPTALVVKEIPPFGFDLEGPGRRSIGALRPGRSQHGVKHLTVVDQIGPFGLFGDQNPHPRVLVHVRVGLFL